MNKNSYWVYILYCDNDSLYTGYTNNLEKRFKQHLNGTGRCKYTQAFKPVSIAQSWDVGKSKSVAMKIEFLIKKLPKSEKQKLIDSPANFVGKFSDLLLSD